MKPFIEITTENGQFYYDLFYFLAIVFAGVFFMLDGRRKKFPLTEWALIFASGIIFLIIGTKLFSYTPEEWREILSSFRFPYTERKTILGGIIGGITGIWIAKKLIRFPYPVLDSFAVSFLVAMAIQRIGCFFAGCCFGTPTNVPWAVSYSNHAWPFYVHLDHELITQSSALSLPVHPNQLYQTIMCLIIAFIVWKLKYRLKRPGNLFFTSVAFYLVARFIVEFWRDGFSNGIAGNVWMGLKYLQWILLGAIFIMGLFIFIREHKYKIQPVVIPSFRNPVWYFILLSIFVLMAGNWFTKTEFFFIVIVLTPTTILQLNKILKQNSDGFRFRLASVYGLIFVLLFIGMVTAQKSYNELTKDETSRNSFTDVQLGYGNLNYFRYHSPPDLIIVPPVGGCLPSPGGSYYQGNGPKFQHNSDVFGIGLSHTETFGKYQKLKLGIEMCGGRDVYYKENLKNTNRIYDINPSVKFDGRWIGVGLGFHGGSKFTEYKMENFIYSISENPETYYNFSGSIRLFPYDIFYAECRYNEMFPYQIGHRSDKAYQLLIGTGFGYKDGSCLEAGYDGNGKSFFSVNAWFFQKLGIKASLYSCNAEYINRMLQFSVSYRFIHKHWNITSVEKTKK